MAKNNFSEADLKAKVLCLTEQVDDLKAELAALKATYGFEKGNSKYWEDQYKRELAKREAQEDALLKVIRMMSGRN